MKKNKNDKGFKTIVGIMISMGVGAGAMYLANYKQIEFMKRYPVLLEADEYARDTLLIEPPQNPDTHTVSDAYFALYGDKYTFVEDKADIESTEYALNKVNNSSTAKESGFRVQFNEEGKPYFSAIVEGLPADKQGLEVGDVIKNIDDLEVTEYKHAVRLVGKDGEKAKLIIQRDGKEISMDFIRCADNEKMDGVSCKKYGDTLYVSLADFYSERIEPFKKVLSENKFDSVIIDLRENGGGYTQVAVEIADMFIGESKTVLTAHSNEGDDEIYETDKEIIYNVPVVVLVNEKTASAAEIMTSLMKQYGDVTLVGMKTFGKGIYQNIGFFKGESVRYTDGYYTVGDWENYHGKGITPDVVIDMDSQYIGTDKDVQLEKAIELLK